MFDFDELSEGEEAEAPAGAPAGAAGAASSGEGSAVDQELRQRLAAEARSCSSRNDLAKWCLKYGPLGFPLPAGTCRCRIFCFHNAGSAESVFTGPAGNPVLAWVKESKAAELVAVSYPGRDKLTREKVHTATGTLCEQLLPVLWPLLEDGVPFVFWGHSVGTWVAFELLMLMRRCGVGMPKACLFNAFPNPDLPEGSRPWRRSRTLDKAQFREEVTLWDRAHFEGRAAVVFDEPDWTDTWEPLMRGDFQLFDEYQFGHAGAEKFGFPIHTLAMENDHKLRPELLEGWQGWSEDFNFEVLKDTAHLTSCYVPAERKAYFEKVLAILKRYVA